MDRVSIKVWDRIEKHKRAAFIRSCRGLNAAKLKGRMKKFAIKEVPSVLTTFAGLWMNTPDLKSKYKDKPEELEAVRAHTNKFVRVVNGWNLCEADEIRTKKRMMDCSPERL